MIQQVYHSSCNNYCRNFLFLPKFCDHIAQTTYGKHVNEYTKYK